jgi:hypothetical protein
MIACRVFRVVAFLAAIAFAPATFSIPAFPGAEGGGAKSIGGRGPPQSFHAQHESEPEDQEHEHPVD